MSDLLLDRIADAIGPAALVTGPDEQHRYLRSWPGDRTGRARAVVCPSSTDEVAALVAIAREAGVSIVPQGGNTGLVEGGIPSEDGTELLLSLERLGRIREVDAANFSLVAEAGCILSDIQSAAGNVDRLFPLSLGAQGSCRIGGNLATNAGGSNVLRYGMARDLVLGLEAVLPDGRVWNGLKSLRKNNTGYDLKQLFIGAEGTLGIITAASLKLFPKPTQTETAFLAVPSVEAALTLYGAARRDLSDLLSAFELMARPCLDLTLAAFPDLQRPLADTGPFSILLEASASGFVELAPLLERFLAAHLETGTILDGTVARSASQSRAIWRIREALVEAQHRAGRHLGSDVSVRLSDLGGFILAADAALRELDPSLRLVTYGHLGDGNLHYNVLPPPGLDTSAAATLLDRCERTLFAVVDRFGGSISAEHGIGRLKRAHFLERLSPLEADLMRRLKTALDPDGLMNPGRILPQEL